ncbi:MAG: sigma-54-dependent Fis family transcriptional regulator [Deltaproteobacteria bacterium]|nr:sigma-54-dependent Fis family transcriptional regulator [Deltaproteobacteria bacterium]
MSAEKYKILITDDDANLRDLLTEAVRGWGCQAGSASDGEEAIEKLKAERFDMVITDLMMPGMDGIELLKHVTAFDKDILVVIITGYAAIETALKAIREGAYDYIAKPFRLDELRIVVKNGCERIRLARQNNSLQDELRVAYGQIAAIKGASAGVFPSAADAWSEPPAAREAIAFDADAGISRQQEYAREAERAPAIKPFVKA